ncbi:MAG: bifunctional heptose 7-phosphate kinase/heptose 1-phosphate adenyltransferase, partial [Planctomycetota bacterium]
MTLELLRTIEDLPVPEVLVVGDLILDRYVAGSVDRISPEAPIQVLKHSEDREAPGGMAGVARNLARLGAKVRVVGLIGEDAAGAALHRALREAGIGSQGLVTEPGRPTTVKTRFVATSQHARQQILRVDREWAAPPGLEAAQALAQAVHDALPEVEMLVLSDYAKGMLSGSLCADIIDAAKTAGVKVVVDPKGTDFDRYRGATAITPNRAEAGAATGRVIAEYEDAAEAAQEILDAFELEVVYITLDRDGIFVLDREAGGTAIHTEPREVYDVTGAGDN